MQTPGLHAGVRVGGPFTDSVRAGTAVSGDGSQEGPWEQGRDCRALEMSRVLTRVLVPLTPIQLHTYDCFTVCESHT